MRFSHEIIGAAKEKAQKILEEAKRKKETLLKIRKKEWEEKIQRELEKLEKELVERRKECLSGARIEARRILSRAREQHYNRILNEVLVQLNEEASSIIKDALAQLKKKYKLESVEISKHVKIKGAKSTLDSPLAIKVKPKGTSYYILADVQEIIETDRDKILGLIQ